LNARERDLLTWVGGSLPPSERDHLLQQIAAARVTSEDGGGLSIEVPASTPPVTSTDGFNLGYDDVDGVPVEFLIAFVDGRLSWFDRYRITADRDPETKVPLVEQTRVLLQ
jgi:hypothetical protein